VSITAEYFAVLEYDEYDNTLLPPPILYKIREIPFVIEGEKVYFVFFSSYSNSYKWLKKS